MPTSVYTEHAPAKINLALHVTGRRETGYHDIQSLVVFADIGDELRAQQAAKDTLSISGPFAAGLGNGPVNLVNKAITQFRERWPDAVPYGLAIELIKSLPIAAGIGGGSADAAAALRLMARMSEHDIPVQELHELALGLGADVPVCLIGQPAIMTGIGEQITPLKSLPKFYIVLVNPQKPLATADVFRALVHPDNAGLPALNLPLAHAVTLALWLADTRNDLTPAANALMPELAGVTQAIGATAGCVLARMSGSGATLFGLYGNDAQAVQASHDLRKMFPDYWIAAAPLLD